MILQLLYYASFVGRTTSLEEDILSLEATATRADAGSTE